MCHKFVKKKLSKRAYCAWYFKPTVHTTLPNKASLAGHNWSPKCCGQTIHFDPFWRSPWWPDQFGFRVWLLHRKDPLELGSSIMFYQAISLAHGSWLTAWPRVWSDSRTDSELLPCCKAPQPPQSGSFGPPGKGGRKGWHWSWSL